MKTLIERNLKFDKMYIYLSITRGSIESDQFTCCDNCGKLITNMVTVVCKSTHKKYTIGVDCAETLSKAKCLYNNGTETDFYTDIYSYNKVARVVTELNKGKHLTDHGFMVSVINDKGKIVDCLKIDLIKYYPEFNQ